MSRTDDKLDRGSAVDAAAVISAICPDDALRREVLQCLLESITFVERASSQAWSVTLFNSRFRLNVGQVEALTCGVFADEKHVGKRSPLEVRLLTQGELPAEVWTAQQQEPTRLQIWPTPYTSVPSPQHAVCLSFERAMELGQWRKKLEPAHQRYLAAALRTPTGKTRSSTTHRRTHSKGLVEYAMAFCGSMAERSAPTTSNEDDLERTEFFEGRPIAIQTTRYERSVGARSTCLSHHGYTCLACGFNFGKTYGPVATHYVQVHHLKPLAAMGSAGACDPINDLAPLCANCHAVAHFRNPPYSVEELRSFINKEHKS